MASSAAAGLTIFSSEPARNTVAWSTASSSGFTPSSGGMRGKTAAPSGTSASPAMSASGDCGDDAYFVPVLHGRLQVIQIAHVLVVEIHVDEAAHLAVFKDALGYGGEFLPKAVERRLDRAAGHLDNCLAFGVLPHGGRDVNTNRHDYSVKQKIHAPLATPALPRGCLP